MNKELKIPNHVGIILDGNGRWAKKRGLVRSMGHKAGFDNLKKLALHILSTGTKYLSVYAFSTENFNRPKDEVDYLMNLFLKAFQNEKDFFVKNNIKVVFSGRETNLSKEVINAMRTLEEESKDCTLGTFNICLNYGGRAEIIDAVNYCVNNNITVTEESFKYYLYKDLPDIDFLIRTSGEERVSNFMLYQLSYAEFYFPETLFPDFDEKEYDKALTVYTNRDRRFGSIKEENK